MSDYSANRVLTVVNDFDLIDFPFKLAVFNNH